MHRNVLNRLYLPLSVILSLLISGIASAQSQQEMNVEAAMELEQADKKLNQVYKELIEQGDPDEDKALRAAQRAWLAYVELHLNYVFPLKKGENPRQKFGSSYSMRYNLERAALLKARAKDLELYLNEEGE